MSCLPATLFSQKKIVIPEPLKCFPHALELSKKGYNAFALIYRPGAQTACEDLSRAIAFIFTHADELQVDTSDYSLWGGSAGARMAAWVGIYGTASYRTMEQRIRRIQTNGTNAEIEVFKGLSHGFGLGEGTVAEGWLDHAVEFWENNLE